MLLKKFEFVLKTEENTVGKVRKLSTSIFSFSYNVFRGFFFRVCKVRNVWSRLKPAENE